MILCISVLSAVIYPFLLLTLLIWFFSLFFLMSLANGLPILFIFPKNQLLALLTFAMVSFVSFAFIHAPIFFPIIFISWRLLTLQYCSGFCHTLTWISHGFTCVPYPEPPSHLPPHPTPLGHPSALAASTCLMHPAWAGDLFHPW